MSAVSKESEDEAEAAGTSSMMESTMMEGEEYYNPDPTVAWSEKVAGGEQLCRICAGANEYLIPIFSGEGLEHQLGMKIEKHLPIQVLEQDKLPVQVCYQCASTLIAWHDLVVGCVEAEKKLQQLYQQENAEEEEEEDDFGDDDRTELFNDPVDSEMAEDPLEPSTSTSTATRSTRSPRKKTVTRAKPKLKMTLVKTPAALPKSPPKLLQPKEEQVEADPATERMQEHMKIYLDLDLPPVAEETCIEMALLDDVNTSIRTTHSCETTNSVLNPAKAHIKLEMETCIKEELLEDAVLSHQMDRDETPNSVSCAEAAPKPATNPLESVHIKKKIRKATSGRLSPTTKGRKGKGLLDTSGVSNSVSCPVEASNTPVNRKAYTRPKRATRKPSNSNGKKTPKQKANKADHLKCYAFRPASCTACGNNDIHTSELLMHIQLKCVPSSSVSNIQPISASGMGATNSVVDDTESVPVSNTPHSAVLVPTEFTSEVGDVAVKCGTGMKQEKKLIRCKLCSNKFTSTTDKDVHMELNHKENKCKICSKFLFTKTQQETHFKKHVESPNVSTIQLCPICGKSCKCTSSFSKHIKIHYPPTHMCNICDYKSRFQANLQDHMRRHNNERPYVCEMCGRAFICRMEMTLHQKVHSNERPFACRICGITFKRSVHCKKHETVMHGTKIEASTIQICSVCNQRCKTKQGLLDHMNVHTGNRPYACTACDKTFRTKNTLFKHRLVHKDKTFLFACDLCDKKYNAKLYLTRHQKKIHNKKELSFPCGNCDKRFDSRSGVVSHNRVVHFIQGDTKLIGDTRVVTDSNRFTCNDCTKSFGSKLKLVQHLKRCIAQ